MDPYGNCGETDMQPLNCGKIIYNYQIHEEVYQNMKSSVCLMVIETNLRDSCCNQ